MARKVQPWLSPSQAELFSPFQLFPAVAAAGGSRAGCLGCICVTEFSGGFLFTAAEGRLGLGAEKVPEWLVDLLLGRDCSHELGILQWNLCAGWKSLSFRFPFLFKHSLLHNRIP